MSPIKYGGTFFLKVFHGRWGQFLGARLLRGCSAWWINDQIIMPRAGKFSLGEQVRAALRFTLWTSGKRKLCMVLCHICHIWRSRGGGRFEVIIWRVAMQATGWNSNREGGVEFSLYVILLC